MADAEHTLRDLLNKILDEKNYKPRDVKIKAINSGGANYTSALFLVTISCPDRDDLKIFAKVAIISDMMRSTMSADWLFDTERFVYTKLVNIYKNIEVKNNVPIEHRYVFPKFYGHNAEYGKETIVIENLLEKGYKPYDRFKCMDWDYASAAVENLAKFHALSFAFAKTDPEDFEKLTSSMQFKIAIEEEANMDEVTKNMFMKMIDGAVEHVKENQKDNIRNFILTNGRLDKYIKSYGKPVIAHGDYRMSNLLYRKQNKIIDIVAVDYQTVHAGNPACDLIYFIFLGSDEEFRRKYYEKLLDHYYKHLEKALERLSIIPREVYPRTKFYKDIKSVLPVAIILGVMVLPVVTIDAESAPVLDDKTDVKDFIIEPNKLYAERFRGIVNDCINWRAI